MADETQPEVTPASSSSDRLPNRVVVLGLVFVLFTVVIGMIALPMFGKEAPSEISAIAMPIITALAAILQPPRSK